MEIGFGEGDECSHFIREAKKITSLTGSEVLQLLRCVLKLNPEEGVCINGGYVRLQDKTVVLSRGIKKYLYRAIRKGGWKVELNLDLDVSTTKTLEALRKTIEIGDRLFARVPRELPIQNKDEVSKRLIEANKVYNLVRDTIPKLYVPEARKKELDEIKFVCDKRITDLRNRATLANISLESLTAEEPSGDMQNQP